MRARRPVVLAGYRYRRSTSRTASFPAQYRVHNSQQTSLRALPPKTASMAQKNIHPTLKRREATMRNFLAFGGAISDAPSISGRTRGGGGSLGLPGRLHRFSSDLVAVTENCHQSKALVLLYVAGAEARTPKIHDHRLVVSGRSPCALCCFCQVP